MTYNLLHRLFSSTYYVKRYKENKMRFVVKIKLFSILILFLTLALLFNACGGGGGSNSNDSNNTTFSEWDGSIADTLEPTEIGGSEFDIHTAAQLAALAQQGSYPQGNTYRLRANIDLMGENWTPIGSQSIPFKGSFDGGNHTIKGLKLPSIKYSGLFGLIQGTSNTEKDVKIENINIESTDIIIDNDEVQFLGALAGQIRYAEIKNISVKNGSLNITSSTYLHVGGITGDNWAVNILNSSSSVDITAKSTSSWAFAGGIIGHTIDSNGSIKSCYSTGNIKAISDVSFSYAGGIVGLNYQREPITSCYSTGNITATSETDSACAGGIAGGNNGGEIASCYSSGNVEATSTSNAAWAGGITSTNMNNSPITSCYTTGEITATGYGALAGGIMAYGYDMYSLSLCYTMGEIKANGQIESIAGGIAGYLYAPTTLCYASGNITATTNGTQSFAKAGGIAGTQYKRTATFCYATGNVTVISEATSDGEHSYCYAGGIMGETNLSSSISSCYATGNVTANANGIPHPSYAGGIVGYNPSGVIERCVALNENILSTGDSPSSGRISGSSYVTYTNNIANSNMSVKENTSSVTINNSYNDKNGYSLPLNQLKGASTYTSAPLNWGNEVWKFHNNGYPTLQ